MMEELTSEQVAKRRDKTVSKRRRQEENDLRVILNLPEGRRFLGRLLATCELDTTISPAWGLNQVFFAEGKRHIGLAVKQEILQVDPELYIIMQREAARAVKEESDG